MSDIFPVTANWAARAKVDAAQYEKMHAQAVQDPQVFWGEHGKRLDWIKPYTRIKNTSFNETDFGIKWYEDGTLNVSVRWPM
jgi:acetyl-CoA synthetase